MNIDLNQEQKLIKSSAKEFLEKEFPKDVVRQLEESEEGYSPELWEKTAELGWVGLNIPEEYEGMGMDFLDLVILLEEIGSNLMPGPFFSTVMGAFPIIDGGSEEQKKEYLPRISMGELKLALAITEPTATYHPWGIEMGAVEEGDEYILNGTKLFVENGHLADYLICAVRTKEGGAEEEGISLLLVDAKSPGIDADVIPSMGIDKQCELTFKDVRVPKGNLLGEQDQGWALLERTLEKAQVGKCAEMLGGMRAAMDMTNAYVKKRETYGRTVSSYQVIQHYLANIWVNVETSKNITYLAAWKIREGLPSGKEVSAAKSWVGQCYTHGTERCVQMHGALGLTREHDIGLYYRYAKACDLAYGDGDYQKEVIAKVMNF
ncbi:acyl-CoA dehydrogenase family protein [Thermodesulfobacteriota bacterium]